MHKSVEKYLDRAEEILREYIPEYVSLRLLNDLEHLLYIVWKDAINSPEVYQDAYDKGYKDGHNDGYDEAVVDQESLN
jgi:hypothetical protein